MVKLQGTIIQANGAWIAAGNVASDAPEHNGRFTWISNMTTASQLGLLPTPTPETLVQAYTRNDAVLKTSCAYDPGADCPYLPSFPDGVAVQGVYTGSFWRQSVVIAHLPPTPNPMELVVLREGDSVFEGYDEVYVLNTTETEFFSGYTLLVSDTFSVPVPPLAPSQTYATTVGQGLSVTLIPPAEGEGSPEGIIEGGVEGTVDGSTEGITEGITEGTPEGVAEGISEGILEGNGEAEGSMEGTQEGVPEGISEGEGSMEGEGTPSTPYHSGDYDNDGRIGLSELLRVIQFYNVGAYRCASGTEDGYAPGEGYHSCAPHNADYNPQDWRITLSELLRVIQFYNSGGYHRCSGSEDGFCPGPAK